MQRDEEEKWVVEKVCTVGDLKTLSDPKGWLNASIINACISKFLFREDVQVMDAFFFHLVSHGQKTDLVRPPQKRFLVFPVNSENIHWSLGVIDMHLQRRILFDSLHRS